MEVIFEMIEKYRILLNDVYVEPYIFIHFTLILFAVFLIRLAMTYNYYVKGKKHNKKVLKREMVYYAGHSLIELLVSFIVCYGIVKLTLANPESYIVNYIIGPACGTVAAIWFDNRVIIKLENINEKDKDGNDKKSDSGGKDQSNINININQSDNTSHHSLKDNIISAFAISARNTDKQLGMIRSMNDNLVESDIVDVYDSSSVNGEYVIAASPVVKHMDKDNADDDDFNTMVIDAINEIKDTQYYHGQMIDNNTEALNDTMNLLKALTETEMNDKKIELKSMIYDCLNKGYATPKENDKITSYYKSYRSLKGNGEVQELYENHYLKLPIHEDRRQSDYYLDSSGRRRCSVNDKYRYGEFDPVE